MVTALLWGHRCYQFSMRAAVFEPLKEEQLNPSISHHSNVVVLGFLDIVSLFYR
jgi:hypothetical protein